MTVDDPAARARIRQALKAHGDVIKSDHPLVGAFSAVIHSDDVAVLANLPGRRYVRRRGGSRLGAGTPASSAWLTSTLRETLGLSPGSTRPRAGRQGRRRGGDRFRHRARRRLCRPHHRVLGLHEGLRPRSRRPTNTATARTSPASSAPAARFRTTCCRVSRRRVKLRQREGARQDGRGQDERRHQGHRVRHRELQEPERPDHQPLARPSDLRAGRKGPARARRSRKRARPASSSTSPPGTTGRTRRPARPAMPASTRRATRRRRSPSAPRSRRTPSLATTTASRPYARAVRPGTTVSSSRTSSRRATS